MNIKRCLTKQNLQTREIWNILHLSTLLHHKYQYYKHLAHNNCLARGMPPASRQHTRHNSGNGYGDSPGHGPDIHLFSKYHISLQYNSRLCYESCIGYSIHKHYTSQSDIHYAIRWDICSGNHYGIYSRYSKKISITHLAIEINYYI